MSDDFIKLINSD